MYATKYFTTVRDAEGNDYSVNLLKNGYVGDTINIRHRSTTPLIHRYRGGREEENKSVYGSEVIITLYSKEDEDFTDLINSSYKDWKVEIRKEGTLFWIGWLQPQFITTRYVEPAYFIQLTATDGLQELSEIPFPSSSVSGFTSIISILRDALTGTGIERDIETQVSFFETSLMNPVTDDNFMEVVKANTKRFIDAQDGKVSYTNCLDVISDLLKTFNAYLIQENAKWLICAKHEALSKRYRYSFTGLTQTNSTWIDRRKDVSSNYVLINSDELSKIEPLKKYKLTFLNKNLGQNVDALANEDWSNGNFDYFNTSSPKIQLASPNPNTSSGNPNLTKYIESDFFFVDSISTGDTISVNLAMTTVSMNTTLGRYPFLKIRLYYPNGTYIEDNNLRILSSTTGYRNSKTFLANQTGSYKIRLYFIPDSTENYSSYSLEILYVEANVQYNSEITFDKYYEALSSISAIASVEDSILFADADHTEDIGALRIGNGLTKSWIISNGEKEQFTNTSFSTSLTGWNVDSSIGGTAWGQAEGDAYVNGSNSSQILYQGVFKTGEYTITASVTNDNEITVGGGITANGYIKLLSKTLDGNIVDIESKAIESGSGATTIVFSFTITDPCYLGFMVFRAGPGTDLDMKVHSFSVTSFESEGGEKTIQELYSYLKLKTNSKFRDYLRITLKTDNSINFNDLLVINDKMYSIVAYENDVLNSRLNLELCEFITEPITVSTSNQSLTTVDGVSSSAGGSNSVYVAGVTSFEFNEFKSEVENTYLEKTDFSTWSGSTLPNLYTRKTAFTTFSGTTLPANYQAKSTALTSIAGLSTSSNQMLYTTGSDTYSTTTLTSFARTILDDSDAASVRTTIGAQPLDADLTAISNFSTVGFAVRTNTDTWEQRQIIGGSYITVTNGNGVGGNVSISLNDAGLQSIAGLSTTSDQMLYTTASNVFATTTLTSFARTILDDSDAATVRTTIGAQASDADLTAIANLSSTGIAVRTGTNTWAQRELIKGSNISITNSTGAGGNPTIAVTGLTIGTNVQAYDADLTAIANLSSTGIAVRTGTNTWAQRTIEAGTNISVSNGAGTAGNPSISISGQIPVANGGTGANNAADARVNLGIPTFDIESTTASYDWPSIAAGATTTIDFAGHLDVVYGDTVIVAPHASAASMTGLVWNGWVSATNMISISIHNTTGSAINLPNMTWTLTRIKT